MDIVEIKQIMCEVLQTSPEQIPDNIEMKDLDSWDSMTHMQLIVTIEGSYGFELTGDEIAEMNSLQAIFDIVQKKNELMVSSVV